MCMMNEDLLSQGVRMQDQVRPLKMEVTSYAFKVKTLRDEKTAVTVERDEQAVKLKSLTKEFDSTTETLEAKEYDLLKMKLKYEPTDS